MIQTMFRFAIAIVALSLFPARAWSAGAAKWDYSLFPEEIQNRIALSASEMPAFPLSDSTFLDPHAWPATFVVGDTLDLKREWWADGGHRMWSADSSDLSPKPGRDLHLCYVKRGSAGIRVGPDYLWNEAGRIEWMRWHQPDPPNPEEYMYWLYPSGRVESYTYGARKRSTDPDGAWQLDEYFDGTGALKGVHWWHLKKGDRFWWRGRSVSGDEWVKVRTDELRSFPSVTFPVK
jgi:hypothetical protein